MMLGEGEGDGGAGAGIENCRVAIGVAKMVEAFTVVADAGIMRDVKGGGE
jgi:hypothetical protein